MGFLNKNPYSRAGLGLLIAGVVIALPAYFLLALTWYNCPGDIYGHHVFHPACPGQDHPQAFSRGL